MTATREAALLAAELLPGGFPALTNNTCTMHDPANCNPTATRPIDRGNTAMHHIHLRLHVGARKFTFVVCVKGACTAWPPEVSGVWLQVWLYMTDMCTHCFVSIWIHSTTHDGTAASVAEYDATISHGTALANTVIHSRSILESFSFVHARSFIRFG